MKYSTCNICGGKTNVSIGVNKVKIGPCCLKKEGSCLAMLGFEDEEKYKTWWAKFRPEKELPKVDWEK